MAYEPTTWQTGDVVTAEKLNKLENGVASSGSGGGNLIAILTYNSTDDYFTLDKSWQDIKNTLDAGGIVVAKEIGKEIHSEETLNIALIWYLSVITQLESSIANSSYAVEFKNLSENEKITLAATDPNALLTTLSESGETPE